MKEPPADSVNDLGGLWGEVPAAALSRYYDVQALRAGQEALERWPMLRKLREELQLQSPHSRSAPL